VLKTTTKIFMNIRIQYFGNRAWIPIPRRMLEKAGLDRVVEVNVGKSQLVIRPVRRPRSGWAASFREMASAGDDLEVDKIPPSLSTWDEREWHW
jgi:antitoxin MazE